MNLKRGWLIALLIAVLLVAACGPEMATPTSSPTETAAESPATAVPSVEVPPTPTVEPVPLSELVDAEDWHILGSPDAPVTIVEYSDFQ
jgi:protein-disulfide isomerase